MPLPAFPAPTHLVRFVFRVPSIPWLPATAHNEFEYLNYQCWPKTVRATKSKGEIAGYFPVKTY